MRISKILLASLALATAATATSQSVASVRLNPPSFTSGQSSLGTVYLSTPTATAMAVNLTSSRAAFSVPASVTVPAGASSATFVLSTTATAGGSALVTATGGGATRKTYATTTGSPFLWNQRVSLTSTDAQANSGSGEPYKAEDGDSRKISADGRYVVFTSQATNLVPSDKNRKMDVFLRDIQLGTTTRVSQLATGVEANGNSYQPSLSADGNFVAFVSDANNLVAGDMNALPDVFLWNRGTKEITLVSRNGKLFANDASYQPSVSKTGRYVAYQTYASNLAPDDANGWADIYIFDSTKGTSKRVSVGFNPWAAAEPNGDCASPSVSADGRYVAFESFADNLVDKDFNGSEDVFVRDVSSGTTTRASVDPDGLELNGPSFCPSLSANGKVVAFTTYAPLIDEGDNGDVSAKILVREMASPASKLSIQLYYADVIEPSISADGRFVAFTTYFWQNDTLGSVGVFDRTYGNITFVNADRAWDPSLSSDGRLVALTTSSRNLVSDDSNGKDDVFVTEANGQQPVTITGPNPDGSIPTMVAGDSVWLKVSVKQAPTSPLTVSLAPYGPGVSCPATVTIAAGSLSTGFRLTSSRDALGESPGIIVTANSRSIWAGVNVANAMITVTPDKVAQGGSVTVKIRISQPSSTPIVFDIYSAYGLTYPSRTTLAAGATTRSFTLKVPADFTPGVYYVQANSYSSYYMGAQFEVVAK